MFKIGDLVKGKRTGNIVQVLEDQTDSDSFAGVIVSLGHTPRSMHVGYESRDWAADLFELVVEEFWKV